MLESSLEILYSLCKLYIKGPFKEVYLILMMGLSNQISYGMI